ncbi:putative proteasome subunit alpha [Metarhizium acridum CQMa 102]|uniref:Proteasome subunit alpha type n=1 Tax=Metarhizium acridum (strain CQMa 102) TaxID=655827 RepID=E9E243_METAQ|nr:putative proteasome subunit alpha [Metarhizium acridum CQMa 102]EFY89959.1 putative proteasome subunit alpha [Metarhizium acridum CQMa 102]
MFRNNYDNDSVTFSPQGRIFQIEYAAEAVKQGSVVVGIVSKTHAVLCAVKAGLGLILNQRCFANNYRLTSSQRNAEELSSYQKKLFSIDEHAGIAIAGLTSDARVLSNFMKQQCLGHRLTYGRAIPLRSLVDMIGEKAQTNTQVYGRRPYGVGLLVAGVDERGPHLFEFQPSGMTEEMVAFAIGARSQMARTYLERNVESFADCSREELVRHGLKALRESLVQDKELTVENTSVGLVGVQGEGMKDIEVFKLYEEFEVKQWIDSVGESQGSGEGEEGMDVDS